MSPLFKQESNMPIGNARFGPVILDFSNATPGVITVDNSYQVFANETIRVAGLVDDQSAATLNGIYTVDFVTPTAITLLEDTSSKSVYISGGYVTVVTLDEPTSPNPPYDRYNNVPDFWNQANQI
jgi:hypothetical protein